MTLLIPPAGAAAPVDPPGGDPLPQAVIDDLLAEIAAAPECPAFTDEEFADWQAEIDVANRSRPSRPTAAGFVNAGF